LGAAALKRATVSLGPNQHQNSITGPEG
jgi:hypothetical protein